jgi:hypothetical protein
MAKCEKTRKRCYDNKDKAEGGANKQFKVCGILLRTYKCPFCRYYHLTKKI